MAHVIVLDSINEDIFVCGQCKCVLNTLKQFLEHKESKCNEQTIEKERCSKISSEVENKELTKSRVPGTDDSINNIGCKLCSKKFKKVKGLLAHMKIHTEHSYQCPICGRCFMQNSHLQRHILTHKVWPEGLAETTAKSAEVELLSYFCSFCSLTMSNFNQYRAHLKNHLALKKYKCIQNRCSSFYEKLESLLEHVLITHKTPVYECHICNSNFNSLKSVAEHQQNHSAHDSLKIKSKIYKCSQCDAVFKKSEKLSLHLLTENHRKICIHCNKIFASDKRLRLHLQIHRKSKPFQCNICSASFHMKKYLTTHMLKHGKREFQCSICKSMFKRQDLLQRHMKLHQMKKPFQCPFRETLNCHREFNRSDKLKSHLKCHTVKYDAINVTECEST